MTSGYGSPLRVTSNLASPLRGAVQLSGFLTKSGAVPAVKKIIQNVFLLIFDVMFANNELNIEFIIFE